MSHFADDDTIALIESLKQQLAEAKEKYADLEFVWKACEQELAEAKAQHDRDVATLESWNTAITDLQQQLASKDSELEVERLRLAACGVVALSNTRESADKARSMDPQYRSASLGDVERAVDAEMDYREQLAAKDAELIEWREKAKTWLASPEAAKQLEGYREMGQKLAEMRKQNVLLRTALEKTQWGDFSYDHTGDGQYACPKCGNLKEQSHAPNCPVGMALDATQDLSGCIICDAEPVGFKSIEDRLLWRQRTDYRDEPLYKAKENWHDGLHQRNAAP